MVQLRLQRIPIVAACQACSMGAGGRLCAGPAGASMDLSSKPAACSHPTVQRRDNSAPAGWCVRHSASASGPGPAAGPAPAKRCAEAGSSIGSTSCCTGDGGRTAAAGFKLCSCVGCPQEGRTGWMQCVASQGCEGRSGATDQHLQGPKRPGRHPTLAWIQRCSSAWPICRFGLAHIVRVPPSIMAAAVHNCCHWYLQAARTVAWGQMVARRARAPMSRPCTAVSCAGPLMLPHQHRPPSLPHLNGSTDMWP